MPSAIVRIFGLLYRGMHDSADSPSYFDGAQIRDALRAAGRSLLPGGILVAGSVVDGARATPFVDYEVLQRLPSSIAGQQLVFRSREGRGLGCERHAIDL